VTTTFICTKSSRYEAPVGSALQAGYGAKTDGPTRAG
jgi:hypothetical protein